MNGFSLDAYHSLDSFGSGILQHMITRCSSRWRRCVITVVVSLLAGYGFSRYRFPLKKRSSC